MKSFKKITAVTMSAAMVAGAGVQALAHLGDNFNDQDFEKIVKQGGGEYTTADLTNGVSFAATQYANSKRGYFVIQLHKADVKGYDFLDAEGKTVKVKEGNKEVTRKSNFSLTLSTGSSRSIQTKDIYGANKESFIFNYPDLTTEKGVANYPVVDKKGNSVNDMVSFYVPYYGTGNPTLTISKVDGKASTYYKKAKDPNTKKETNKFDTSKEYNREVEVYYVPYDEDMDKEADINPTRDHRDLYTNMIKPDMVYRGFPFSLGTSKTYMMFDEGMGTSGSIKLDIERVNRGNFDGKGVKYTVFPNEGELKKFIEGKSASKSTGTIKGEGTISLPARKGNVIMLESEDYGTAVKLTTSASGGSSLPTNPTDPNEVKPQPGNKLTELQNYLKYKSTRVAGKDRYDTAAKVANLFGKAETAVIVSGENFPDAISAGPLAKLHDAPILMVKKNIIPAETEKALKDLGVKKVFIVGGRSTISDSVVRRLNDYNPTLIDGKDRYETSLNIAKKVLAGSDIKEVFVADGKNFADALSVSPAAKGAPVVLVNNRVTSQAQDAFKAAGIKKYTIVGGTGSVSSNVATTLGNGVVRVSGKDRYQTSLMIAKKYFKDVDRAFLASGENYPDSLAVGALALKEDSPLLLTRRATLPNDLGLYLLNNTNKVTIIGGTGSVADVQVLGNIKAGVSAVDNVVPTDKERPITK